MKKINEIETKKIKGGFSIVAILSISAMIAFLAGVIEGYVHPKKCGGEIK